ncbi:MAG: membrane-bound PQQ-dependent dehydrogenase, glucose/quinate/shikimate family [Mesorhizobium amorphae]|nr:MAG: membrane-bound PQQ-dependent dehydrogenase, glucose/quinate/shikimate family [Mesorhizobium amorphae]
MLALPADRSAPHTPSRDRGGRGWLLLFFAGLVGALLTGLPTAGLGAWLVSLGGSWFYLVLGLVLSLGALLGFLGRRGLAVALLGAAVLGTLAWSVFEIAAKGWMPAWPIDLAARTGLVAALFALTLLGYALARGGALRTVVLLGTGGGGAALAALVALGWERPVSPTEQIAATASPPDTDWTAFGGSPEGRRFQAIGQITPENVAGLTEAWRFRTGDEQPNDRVFYAAQNTPLKIGDTLFLCSPGNKVFALDPGTGEERWRFNPKVEPRVMESMFSAACRAVGYHQSAGGGDALCSARVFVTVADGRLAALDARSGAPCTGFGTNGVVDLTAGMGIAEPGHASSNSGPAVIGDLVLVGQQVSDNQRRDAPSGVVRAYDAQTGALRWAWDAKRLDRPREPLATGEIWPQGTPNVWNVISGDPALGLVFLGTGNPGNDHWGGNRDPEDDEYASTVVAVDLASGDTRWHFRTVLNDRFDYDIGAQPVVADVSVDGATRRAVIQATKTGSLFVLDALTGEPLRTVENKPVPTGALPGETLSPVQPQSTFYPNLAGVPGPDPERIDASHAFGVSPIDAALCRIDYHRMRYEGIYTPPSEEGLGTLLFPGTVGGPNWGGIAVDEARGIAIGNHSRLANRVEMIANADFSETPIGDGGRRPDQDVAPQAGAPWGVDRPMWLSPLGVPCIAPPWGFLWAVDLASGALLWSQPLGTGFDMGPLGVPTFLRVPLGTPNLGGPVMTASGVTFIAAAQDDFFRAFETRTGRLLWSARLPAGGQAGAMTYMHAGRQYVAIVATGHAQLQTTPGDSLVVYALPEGTE